jgi:hypothetical protein
MYVHILLFEKLNIDTIKQELHHGATFVFVVDDPDINEDVVLKLIPLSLDGNESTKKYQKMIEKEIKVGMLISKECKYLVSYLEIFEWKNFFCIKMEYFRNRDIKFQLDNGRIFTEEV